MSNDNRVDKAVSWALTFFCGISLSIGAWFFNGLNNSVEKLTGAVGQLRTEVAVMRRDAEIIAELKEEIRHHKSLDGHATLLAKVEALELRIRELERKIDK